MGSEDARNSPEYGELRSMIRYMAVETAMAPTATATKDMGLCFDNMPNPQKRNTAQLTDDDHERIRNRIRQGKRHLQSRLTDGRGDLPSPGQRLLLVVRRGVKRIEILIAVVPNADRGREIERDQGLVTLTSAPDFIDGLRNPLLDLRPRRRG